MVIHMKIWSLETEKVWLNWRIQLEKTDHIPHLLIIMCLILIENNERSLSICCCVSHLIFQHNEFSLVASVGVERVNSQWTREWNGKWRKGKGKGRCFSCLFYSIEQQPPFFAGAAMIRLIIHHKTYDLHVSLSLVINWTLRGIQCIEIFLPNREELWRMISRGGGAAFLGAVVAAAVPGVTPVCTDGWKWSLISDPYRTLPILTGSPTLEMEGARVGGGGGREAGAASAAAAAAAAAGGAVAACVCCVVCCVGLIFSADGFPSWRSTVSHHTTKCTVTFFSDILSPSFSSSFSSFFSSPPPSFFSSSLSWLCNQFVITDEIGIQYLCVFLALFGLWFESFAVLLFASILFLLH